MASVFNCLRASLGPSRMSHLATFGALHGSLGFYDVFPSGWPPRSHHPAAATFQSSQSPSGRKTAGIRKSGLFRDAFFDPQTAFRPKTAFQADCLRRGLQTDLASILVCSTCGTCRIDHGSRVSALRSHHSYRATAKVVRESSVCSGCLPLRHLHAKSSSNSHLPTCRLVCEPVRLVHSRI